jgi:hypothetical protein
MMQKWLSQALRSRAAAPARRKRIFARIGFISIVDVG